MQPVQIDKEKILICIKDNMTQADMAKKFYCTPNVVHRHLDELIKEGCIYREGKKLKLSESQTDKIESKPKKKDANSKIEESTNSNTVTYKEEKITPALTINLGTDFSNREPINSSIECSKIQKTEATEQRSELSNDIEAVVKSKCDSSEHNDKKLNLAIQNAMKDGKRAMEEARDNEFNTTASDRIERKNSEAELKVQKHDIDVDCKLIVESLKTTGVNKKTIERVYDIATSSDENDSDKVKKAFKDLIFAIIEQEIKL